MSFTYHYNIHVSSLMTINCIINISIILQQSGNSKCPQTAQTGSRHGTGLGLAERLGYDVISAMLKLNKRD